MKKLKIIAMTLCMVLFCSVSFSFVGCGIGDNEDDEAKINETQVDEAEAYAQELLSNYNYDVDYTIYNDEDDSYIQHTCIDGVEYIRYFSTAYYLGDSEPIINYYTIAIDYSGNYVTVTTYDETEKTYTQESYVSTSVISFMYEKIQIFTVDGLLMFFLNFEEFFEYSYENSGATSYTISSNDSISTSNGVVTLAKEFTMSVTSEGETVEESGCYYINIKDGVISSFEIVSCDSSGKIEDAMTVTYSYDEITDFNTDFSGYTEASD